MKVRAAAAVALLSLVPFIQRGVDARRAEYQQQEDLLYLWSGPQVRRLSPGLENVMADIYWLRTVQYFGGQKAFATQQRFDLLEPLIEITTTLDPRFEIAYRYGAVFLAEAPPAGAGQPEAAVRLLLRGVEALPQSWRIRQDLGFFLFFFLKDSQQASRVLMEAADLPGAPMWLRFSAADFLRRGGERETSRKVWAHIYEQTDGQMRDNALFNLRRLDALDAQDALQAAVDEFKTRTGRYPATLGELSTSFPQKVVDPSGTPFAYDPGTGKVAIAKGSYFWRASE